MANLNLSEFTEKLFVADADHTFIWDSAVSISKRVSRNSWLNSGTLTSDAPVTISQTWNAGSNVMTALKVVATDTSSGAASNLLELWSGATPALKLGIGKGGSIISKTGTIASNGSANAAGLSLELFFAGYGLGVDNNGNTAFLLNGLAKTRCGFGVAVASDQSIGWTNAAHVGAGVSLDTILLRDGAANTLALRNGAAAQTFRVYNTFPGTGNNEYGEITWDASTLYFRPAATGTATIKNTVIGSTQSTTFFDGAVITFRPSGAARFGINIGGFYATNDNQVDIGFAGSNRPRNLYIASNILAAGNIGIGTETPGAKLQVVQQTTGVGTISVGAGLTTVTGVGTQFTNTFKVGDTITSAGQTLTISAIASDTSMTTSAAGAAISGQPYTLVGGTRMSVLGNGNVGIGTTSPTSKLQVTNGDVEIETVTSGIIMKAAGTSTRYRITLNAGGTALVFTAI